MSSFESITIREVDSSDLEAFYEHQLDPEAIRMVAFVCKDPKDKVAFDAHWNKILNSPQITQRTIKQTRATGDDMPSATTFGVPAAPGSSWELDLLSVVESAPSLR
jgi:hypothetical protein